MTKDQRVQQFVCELTIAAMQQDIEAWHRLQSDVRWYPARIAITEIKDRVILRVANAKGIVKEEGKSLEMTVLGR